MGCVQLGREGYLAYLSSSKHRCYDTVDVSILGARGLICITMVPRNHIVISIVILPLWYPVALISYLGLTYIPGLWTPNAIGYIATS
eukprot:6213565-Pleurochrysis_carterae.AAC.4